MSNSVSPKPSDSSPRWRRWLTETLVVVVVFSVGLAWLTRNMLDDSDSAPELKLPSLQGDITPVNWPATQDKTLLYFFAPWCQICRVSMPGLNLLSEDETNLRIIVVALDWENTAEVRRFIEDVGFEGTVLMGNQQTARDYKISGYPSYYIVNSNGKIEHADRGISTPPGLWLRTQI